MIDSALMVTGGLLAIAALALTVAGFGPWVLLLSIGGLAVFGLGAALAVFHAHIEEEMPDGD